MSSATPTTSANTATVDLRNARVLVTGGTSFLGKHLCRALDKAGAIVFSTGSDFNLEHHLNPDLPLAKTSPDYVFHLAGWNGGIQFNIDFPADIFLMNTIMGLQILDACKKHGVKKVVSVVASCAYPANQAVGTEYESPTEILIEDNFFDGECHPTVACHGYAKRNLQLASKYLNRQFGLKAVCACPTTLYGPGDNYSPSRTKVMGAMVKRFVDAKDNHQQEVVCWGTGAALREFLYVEDAAQLLVQTMLYYDNCELPLNLGTGQEVSIKELSELVARCVEFGGDITWDTTKPDGQIRKRLNLERMHACLRAINITGLETGINQTISDYRQRKLLGVVS